MDDQLLELLDYEGVLSALATTPDGLVVAAAGLSVDDAEVVGAAGSMMFGEYADYVDDGGWVDIGSGAVHLMRGPEISLVVLSESSVSHEALAPLMRDSLESISGVFS